MKKPDAEGAPESDVFAGARHPRNAERLIGHEAAEAEMLSAYREGRLAHAWLIGGPEGVGKATLAWRFAQFLFANPDPNAPAVRDARDLTTDPKSPAARHLGSLAHPDFSLVRRVWQTDKKKFYSEIRVDDIRDALQVFQMSAAFGGWRICLVDCAEDLNANGANALLKMIEEPPARSLILIVSHRPGQVLPTIRSRCRRLNSTRSPRAKLPRWSRRSGRPGARPIRRRSPRPPRGPMARSARRWRACLRTPKASAH